MALRVYRIVQEVGRAAATAALRAVGIAYEVGRTPSAAALDVPGVVVEVGRAHVTACAVKRVAVEVGYEYYAAAGRPRAWARVRW